MGAEQDYFKIGRLGRTKDLLQKFRWGKAWLTAGRNYAASTVNCCLSESGAVDPKLPCSFRIM